LFFGIKDFVSFSIPMRVIRVSRLTSTSEAKFWLTPVVRQAWVKRVDDRTLKMLESVVKAHRKDFEEQWHVFFA
jgi:hypothetical protein